ncbi:MAG: hypothetical protein R8L07_17610 [Alphaproteobacteria bacterium]|nr:hypothetical protein [Alphaproteobacteria bacterium]
MSQAPTHWTEFDKLYNLPDPRPYFRGVATGDYRMPGVMAAALRRLIPALRASNDRPARLVDFASGYGAVGMCLRTGREMADLYAYFAKDAAPEGDAAHFAGWRRDFSIEPHRIDAIDIADRALDYARACGVIDQGHTDNLMEHPPGEALKAVLSKADLVYECGAIGDHVAAAMTALIEAASPNRPVLVLSPRPRVNLGPLRKALDARQYELRTAVPGIRYRRAFSPEEMREELAAGLQNGIAAEECTVDDYFRVDLRLAVPAERDAEPLLQSLTGMMEDDR